MKPAQSLFSFTFLLLAPVLAQSSAAPSPQPHVTISYAPYVVKFAVEGPQAPFLGVVIVSLSSDLQHFLVGLPPLLDQAVIVDWGLSNNGIYSTAVSEFLFPAGVMIHVQGITIGDVGIEASAVGQFVLDLTAPRGI